MVMIPLLLNTIVKHSGIFITIVNPVQLSLLLDKGCIVLSGLSKLLS